MVLAVAGILDSVMGDDAMSDGTGPVQAVVSLALFLPSLAVAVRRLHDTDRSGWWVLLSLVPLVGGIILLVWTVPDSRPGPNRFGASPKQAARAPTG